MSQIRKNLPPPSEEYTYITLTEDIGIAVAICVRIGGSSAALTEIVCRLSSSRQFQ
jgi:hypothetical protein